MCKALSTLATIVAEFGDCSRQCGQSLRKVLHRQVGMYYAYSEPLT